MTKLQKQLQAIIDEEGTGTLKGDVAQSVLDAGNDEEITSYIRGVLENGCVSGYVSSLCYYNDTKEFFTFHMEEIDELRGEHEESTGAPLKIGTPMYNWLAWFAYEETLRKIAREDLGLDY